MSNDAYTTVEHFLSYAAQGMINRQQKKFRLVPAPALLKFFAMGIMDWLSKTKSGKHVIAFTDRYSKLAKAILVTRAATTKTEPFFVDN